MKVIEPGHWYKLNLLDKGPGGQDHHLVFVKREEHQAARRHHRSVPGLSAAISGECCYACGHVGCPGFCR